MLVILLLGLASQSIAGDTWQSKSKIPLPLMGVHAATINDQIYLLGGRHNNVVFKSGDISEAQARMWRFDQEKDTWTELHPMPTARAFFDTAVIDGKMYAVGGTERVSEGEPGLAAVELYDPETDAWEHKTELPTARADLTVSAAIGRLYAIGGASKVGLNALGTVEEYDPTTDTWQRKAEMPTPRLHLTSAVVDNKIYVLGGGPEWPVPTATLEIYDPVINSWSKGPDMPTERAGLWATSLGSKIYVTGGIEWEAEPLTTVEMFDTNTGEWHTLPDLNVPRFLHASATVESKIFVFGGSRADYVSLDSVEVFEP